MLLAIDVGNTQTVLGTFQRDFSNGQPVLLNTWRLSTGLIGTEEEFRTKLHVLCELDHINPSEFDAVIVSSVVPSVTSVLRSVFKNIKLHIIDHQSPFGFTIKANPKEQVGADRLINAEAAVRFYSTPCIVVDSGTATTICAVSRNKEYLGGAIMPGIDLSIESLAKKAAKLFTVELVPPKSPIGENTENALRSGILLGYASMIDGMIERFKNEMGEENLRVIATGGVSQRLEGLIEHVDYYDANLTLKGIASIYDTLRTR